MLWVHISCIYRNSTNKTMTRDAKFLLKMAIVFIDIEVHFFFLDKEDLLRYEMEKDTKRRIRHLPI